MSSVLHDRMWSVVNQQLFMEGPEPSCAAMAVSNGLDLAESLACQFSGTELTWPSCISSSLPMESSCNAFVTSSSNSASPQKCGPVGEDENSYHQYAFEDMKGSSIDRYVSYTDLLSLSTAQLLSSSDMECLSLAESEMQPFSENAHKTISTVCGGNFGMDDNRALCANQASGVIVHAVAPVEYRNHRQRQMKACSCSDEEITVANLGPANAFGSEAVAQAGIGRDISSSDGLSRSPSLKPATSDAVQYKSTCKEMHTHGGVTPSCISGQPEGQSKAQVTPIKSEPMESTCIHSPQEDSTQRMNHNTKLQKQGRKRVAEDGCLLATVKASRIETPPDVVHVRARRGQATDSHSLAERVRREKISQRMKVLQEIVPGCHKVLGKAMMLDEIINYVKSLQKQVEFLSMKLAIANQVGPECIITSKANFFSSNMEFSEDLASSKSYLMALEPLL